MSLFRCLNWYTVLQTNSWKLLWKRKIMKICILKRSSHRCYTDMSPSLPASPEGSRLCGCQKYLKVIVHWSSHCNCSRKNIDHPVHQIVVKVCIPSEGRQFILLWSESMVSYRLSYGQTRHFSGLQARRRARLCRGHCLNPSA